MLIEAAEMLTGNPCRLISLQCLKQELIENTGDRAVLRFGNTRQLLIEVDRNFDPLTILTGWYTNYSFVVSFFQVNTIVFTEVFLFWIIPP